MFGRARSISLGVVEKKSSAETTCAKISAPEKEVELSP